MGVRILVDNDSHPTRTMAVLSCSTSDWAFGPVFTGDNAHDGEERAESFLRWLGARSPRQMKDAELANAYGEWLVQEDAQWAAEEAAEAESAEWLDEPDLDQ